MRRYDDPVEVRKGMVGGTEGPEQFLWRGRLWKVRDVVAHWVETDPWWQSAGVQAVLGAEESDGAPPDPNGGGVAVRSDLTAERELWRVEATGGLSGGYGVFDLELDWTRGSWQLVRSVD